MPRTSAEVMVVARLWAKGVRLSDRSSSAATAEGGVLIDPADAAALPSLMTILL